MGTVYRDLIMAAGSHCPMTTVGAAATNYPENAKFDFFVDADGTRHERRGDRFRAQVRLAEHFACSTACT
jgi:hypothetical protein